MAGPSRGRRSAACSARRTSGRRCASPGARCCTTRRTTRSAAARSTPSPSACLRASTTPKDWPATRSSGCSNASPATASSGARRTPSSRRSPSSIRRRTRAPTWCACALEPYPAHAACRSASPRFPPLLLAALDAPGFAIDGQPARVVASDDPDRARAGCRARTRSTSSSSPRDVPAFGCRRFALTPAARTDETVDDGREIAAGDRARARRRRRHAVGLLRAIGVRDGLLAVEDRGDRGDTYDFDPVADDPGGALAVGRRGSAAATRPASQRLDVHAGRSRAAPARRRIASSAPQRIVPLRVVTEVRVAPGVRASTSPCGVDNTARDHRLRLLFPTGAPAPTLTPRRPSTSRARRPRARRSRLGAPGADDVPASGLGQRQRPHRRRARAARGRGDRRRHDRHHAAARRRLAGALRPAPRPQPAGPPMPVAGAQCSARSRRDSSLLAGLDPAPRRAAELGLRGVIGGDAPLLAAGASLLALEPPASLLSARQAGRGRRRHHRARPQPDRRAHSTRRCALGFRLPVRTPCGSTRRPTTTPRASTATRPLRRPAARAALGAADAGAPLRTLALPAIRRQADEGVVGLLVVRLLVLRTCESSGPTT